MIVGLLFPLIIIGVVVWLAQNRKAGGGGEPGVVSLRRFLSYALLLAALFTAASGATLLLASVLPTGEIAGDRTSQLALGLSLTLVGTPVWALLWRMLARRLRAESTERAASAWSLYLVVAATVSLLVAFLHAVEVGGWLVGVEPYAPTAVAYTVVWAGVWALQVRLLRSGQLAPTGPLPQLAVLAGSGVGLGALAVGTTDVVRYGLDRVYELVAGSTFAQTSATQTLRTGLVVAALAVPVWWWHWVREGAGGPRTGLWHGYVMLVAVLGGLLTAVVSGGIALHSVLQWWLGNPANATASTHFDVMPGALAAAVTGLSVWWYHRRVLDEVALRVRSEPERTFGYLVAAVGLVATAAGVTVAIMAAILALVPPAFAGTADQANTLVLALTLLLVGAPVWWTFWHRLQVQVAGGEPAERRSVSRRAYVLLMIGGAGLTAMVSLASVLFAFFRDLLDGTLAVSLLRDVRTAIGLVVTAGAVAAYHWMVHRADRGVAEPVETAHPRSVLLISADGDRLAAAIAAATGAKVERLHRLDTSDHEVDVEGLTAALLAAPYERVMVTVGDAGDVSVIPYERV